MNTPFNTRILIVDDEEIVRDSLRESLRPPAKKDEVLAAAAAALFDEPEPAPADAPPPVAPLEFEVDEAAGGQAGFAKVKAALAEGRPYAVIFLDMRMPGWDGLRTVQHIREIDTRAEVIFVTAYSDHSVDEVVAKAGANVGYHCKPFAPEEIRQLATKGVHDWHKVRGLEQLIAIIGQLRGGEREINVLLNNILGQIVNIVGTDAALLGRTGPGGVFEPLLGIGAWEHPSEAGTILNLVGNLHDCDPEGGVTLRDNVAIMHLESFRIAALLSKASSFNTEKIYLLKLFLSSAGQALENARLQETVLRSEKLSALGGALAGIVHDLRNPVGNIQNLCDLVDDALREDRPDEVRELIPLVREASGDAMGIVNDVLDFTRKARIERGPLSLETLGRQLTEKTRHIFARGVVLLEVRVPAEATILVDAPKLQRALINLIKNAAEVLEARKVSNPRVTVTLRLLAEHVVIDVADNGPGIPPELQGKLFEPFATHGKSGGTGLGLAIVKQIAESHGGTLTVQSSPAGATFTLRFPNA
ncbi:MAG: hybrid sensor histidine kinase/response regulator [Burkholderiales bacterium]|nr:hybrid sensor histidine kinase/response regulator [Opitutaceae bacterium]